MKHKNSCIKVPEGPGLGVELDEERWRSMNVIL
jgi:L-alanine-DL-glutamate epimerase-like enolase superfamily enzyme